MYSTVRTKIVAERVTVTVATEKSVVRKRGNGRITFSSVSTAALRRAFLRITNSARNAW